MTEKLKQFEKENQATVLFVTKYGSKLYGTENENSDTDYKGVFVQNSDLVLLKKDLDHWTSNTNNTNIKNSTTDTDLQLFSVNKFFELLRKGETGALDLLFSMWSESVVYENRDFTSEMKVNYLHFLNRGLHSFTGYAVGQSQKYGVKGTRYKEVQEFYEYLGKQFNTTVKYKLENYLDEFKEFFEEQGFKYLKVVKSPGPKTGDGENMIEYIEVLGKKFSKDVTFNYFFDRMAESMQGFGNRTKASSEGVDWKSLSHSVRVLFEVEELLKTNFVTFPLREKDFVKTVKGGKLGLDLVMDFVNSKLDEVKGLLETSGLPETSNRSLMDTLELQFLKLYNS